MEKFSWQSERGCQILLDYLHEGIFVVDEGALVYVNGHLANMLGYTVNELIGRSFLELVVNEDRPLVWERHRARIAGENVPEQCDVYLSTAQGQPISCSLSASLRQSPQGHAVLVGWVRDITQKKAELAELEASKMELKSIYDELPDVFYRTNMQGIITMISPSCYAVIGYTHDEMLGTAMSLYYATPAERQKIVQSIVDGGGRAVRAEAALKHKNGSIVWISTNAFVRLDARRQPVSVDGMARDISERKQLEDRLTMLSRTDDLTGAYSRRYFMEKSEEIIKLMRRYQRPVSMMIADLDHFKKINDKYGHHVGDLALIAFIKACKQEIREQDVLGRLGGEEFCLLLPETTLENAQTVVERIRKATAEIEILLADHMIGITVSIGLVELSSADTSLDAVMHRADLAMYQAKERGRNQVSVALT
ncbi:MAG TPA: sensor domain-containing diguanylate cyclase [Gallionellaceae bacterium]|nr:sensor domain-containing diguanylate cyclase [Gallionellaceae bacterium]